VSDLDKGLAALLQSIDPIYQQSFKAWEDLHDDADEWEEIEATTERKYEEGYSDALELVMKMIKKVKEELPREGTYAEGVADTLSELAESFEGIEDTDLWNQYMEEEKN
jgi:archaellum component FlaC